MLVKTKVNASGLDKHAEKRVTISYGEGKQTRSDSLTVPYCIAFLFHPLPLARKGEEVSLTMGANLFCNRHVLNKIVNSRNGKFL